MTSLRSIPNSFDNFQASLSNSSASLDGNKSKRSPRAIPSILALPAILPANVVAFPVLNAFPDFPPGFGAAALGLAVALGFGAVASGLTSGFGVVPSNFGVASYFHPSHLAVDPAGADGGAAGGAVTVLAISPALAFTLKVRAGAEGADFPVPAVALALKAAGGVGDVVGAVATEAGLGAGASYFQPAVDPVGADDGAVNILGTAPALAFTLGVREGATSSIAAGGAAPALAVRKDTEGSGATGATAAGGAEVLLNKLDAFEVYSLTFSLNGTLLIYPLTLSPKFLNIEGFGALVVALGELAALSLAALYRSYLDL